MRVSEKSNYSDCGNDIIICLILPIVCEQWRMRLPEIMDFDGYSVWDT